MKPSRKYKLTKEEQPELTDAEILKSKDYGKFMAKYEQDLKRLHKRPLYKDPKMFLALFIILLVLYLLTMDDKKEQETPQQPEQQEQTN